MKMYIILTRHCFDGDISEDIQWTGNKKDAIDIVKEKFKNYKEEYIEDFGENNVTVEDYVDLCNGFEIYCDGRYIDNHVAVSLNEIEFDVDVRIK